ncbi:hypothetical protein SLEP1_g5868 [Rubroshorea leprosula]|uniref:t-SNARE coiled-coil homology domain-containing protein n=1 Tax=Rubroshorea leprosula TaxID=152421 RepID=A0AAV5I3Z3_9ROSI|nr:hypothetical protein SLEP1_g5868 [Rubroshorea leprosula]
MPSASGDRTAEFLSLSRTLLRIGGIGAVSDHAQNDHLSKAAPGALTALIRNDVVALDTALLDLINFQSMEIAGGNYSKDRVAHSTTVCNDLESKFIGATKHLQDVAHENRKHIFSKNASRENLFQCQRGNVTELPPWSNSCNTAGSLKQSRRRPTADNTPSHYMEMSISQQVIPRQENYTESRAAALHTVESTISELSGISTQLATVVAQQGKLVISIDENMDESLANVEGSSNAVLRHLHQTSSTRWLLIKIFAVIILFLLVFIIFVA